MRTRLVLLLLVFFVCAVWVACSQPSNQPATSTPPPSGAPQPAPGAQATTTTPPDNKLPAQKAASQPAAKSGRGAEPTARATAPSAVPAGTVLTIRMGQAVGSKISRPGESFSASLAQPLEVNGAVVAPSGAPVQGTVAEAVPLGRFKGGAKLRLTLDSIEIGGKTYRIQTSGVSRSQQGKGKRTAVMTGGGAGVGALIGGLAGGGKGAAIGAIAGAGAGGAGAAFTGNKDVVIPAESALSFKLNEPLELR